MLKNKLIFRMNEYDGSHVMHCKNKEEAEILYEYLHAAGSCWLSGRPYIGERSRPYDPNMPCYRFRAGLKDSLDVYSDSEYYTILNFDDYDWDKSLMELLNPSSGEDLKISYDELF